MEGGREGKREGECEHVNQVRSEMLTGGHLTGRLSKLSSVPTLSSFFALHSSVKYLQQ